MGFSDKQERALRRRVPTRDIRLRLNAGRELAYIEGWYALTQANRIFGFDGWDRETVEIKSLQARETRGTYTAIYSARVRVAVRANDAVVVRDGHGTGKAHGSSAGEVHDRALKAAETDATKRALATFGKAFGLALYASTQSSARLSEKNPVRPPATRPQLSSAATNGSRELTIGPSNRPAKNTASDAEVVATREVVRAGPPKEDRKSGG